MMQLHAIAGLPRSGSTLLCDLLNQNPRFYASSTSHISGLVQGIRDYWSNSAEIVSDLADDRDGTEQSMRRVMRALLESWYEGRGEVVFDKGRGWTAMPEVMQELGGKVIVTVRDPRNVLASIEKHRGTFPLLDKLQGKTQLERAHEALGREGMVGGPLAHIEDLIRRGANNVIAVPYERMAAEPEVTMRSLYRDLGEEYYEGHDFDSVDSTATDLDAQYLYKFPHKRQTGPVKDAGTSWGEHIPQGIAEEIVKSFPVYCKTFGYA